MWQLPPLNRIGPEQFSDLFRSTPGATLGQFFNSTIVAFALYSVADPYFIFGWWILNCVICSWTMWRWWNNRHRNITRISSKAIPRAVLSGFLYALPWSILIYVYLGEIPHLEQLLMGIAVLGMAAAGGVQLSRIYPAAFTYLATIFLPIVAKCIAIGEPQYYIIAGLCISYSAYLTMIVLNSATTSIERSVALRDLKSKIVQLDRANDALEKFATEDDLTNLLNRRVLHEQLADSINEARHLGKTLPLLVCDLDHFKNINDTSGHNAGDKLLQEIARRLNNCVESCDIIGRIGGDEFAIIVKSVKTSSDTTDLIGRLMDQVNQPYELGGTIINPGMSVGISVYPLDANSPETMLSHADMALQRGKTHARGQYWFFDSNMRSKLSTDAALEAELRIALEEEQFEMFYQPKVDLSTGRLHGLESLLRWRRPNGDIEVPSTFFPVAEERGLMTYISDFAVEQAIGDICHWQDMGMDPGEVAVNIHPVQIKDPHRMRRFARKVESACISPEKFILEITEDCVVGRGTDDVPAILEYMSEKRFKISFDDFGTGYASLNQLRNLPVDEFKIDRVFVRELTTNQTDRSIVLAMVRLAESLGLSTVAEGIETPEQHNILLAMGCSVGQGYMYGRPMDLETTTEYLRSAYSLKAGTLSEKLKLVTSSEFKVSGEREGLRLKLA